MVIKIKKYANRRLYNTQTSSYITLDDVGDMVKEGIDLQVVDAKTGDDLTRQVLTQIIVEMEGQTGQSLLPVSFLRQLISFYGDSMQGMLPAYLDSAMRSFVANQHQLKSYVKDTLQTWLPPMGDAMQNMEDWQSQQKTMMDNAFGYFMPTLPQTPNTAPESTSDNNNIDALGDKLAELEKEIAQLKK